jgi:hypothetical protein
MKAVDPLRNLLPESPPFPDSVCLPKRLLRVTGPHDCTSCYLSPAAMIGAGEPSGGETSKVCMANC